MRLFTSSSYSSHSPMFSPSNIEKSWLFGDDEYWAGWFDKPLKLDIWMPWRHPEKGLWKWLSVRFAIDGVAGKPPWKNKKELLINWCIYEVTRLLCSPK